jgi:ankyrin repeat protein
MFSSCQQINARNIDGATPLCVACAAGQTEVAKLLIESNASVNPTILIDPLNSPLHEAVMKGELFSELIQCCYFQLFHNVITYI